VSSMDPTILRHPVPIFIAAGLVSPFITYCLISLIERLM
jgi:hypothetical protein